jgi:NRPS condensation-like uncharacterized protein
MTKSETINYGSNSKIGSFETGLCMEKIPILNEQLHLYSPNINICHRITIEGKFDTKQIDEAIRKTGKRHPLLNCFIKIDNDMKAWFVKNTNSLKAEYYKTDEMDWFTWYKKTDNIPFDFEHGPLVRICVIFGKQIEILILLHHIVSDGIGILNLGDDLLLALDNKIDETPQIPPVGCKFKDATELDAFTKTIIKKLNNKWEKNPVHFSSGDYLTLFEQYRKKFVPNLYLTSLEKGNINKLFEKCKLNGLTVTEAIISAFSIAIIELSGYYKKNELLLGIAVNVRNDLIEEPKYCMGNYVSGILTKIKYNPKEIFMVNSKKISLKLKERLADHQKRQLSLKFLDEIDKDFIASTIFAVYGNHHIPISRKLGELIGEQLENKSIGISNLGRYEVKKYDNLKLVDIQPIGPAFPVNLITIDFLTVNNKLNICLRYNETEIKTKNVHRIYERAIEYLCEQ